jgi:hypothetical protein
MRDAKTPPEGRGGSKEMLPGHELIIDRDEWRCSRVESAIRHAGGNGRAGPDGRRRLGGCIVRRGDGRGSSGQCCRSRAQHPVLHLLDLAARGEHFLGLEVGHALAISDSLQGLNGFEVEVEKT